MFLRLHGSLLLVLALLVVAPSLVEAQTTDVLTGRVSRSDGSILEGARIEVISVELETTRSALTDRNGRYMMIFPDGGGLYIVRVSYIGMADQMMTVMRQGDEELILTDFTLQTQAITLDGIGVEVAGGTVGQGDTGEQSTVLTQDLLNRLPLPDLDPSTVAMLAAGVIGTEMDSISGRMGFSVGGMSDLLNQVTLDGIVIGEDGLDVPEEGVRQMQVTTGTFDVSRGGFAGGQVAMTSARGSNRAGGSLSYRLDDDALQMSSSATASAFTRQNFGGSWGGPIIQNKLFYNGSFQLQRNVNHRFALTADDPLSAQRSGVQLDSISRFLEILDSGYGFPTMGKTGPYNQMSGDIRLSGRIDWNAVQNPDQSHSISLRVNTNFADQDSTRISGLDLSERGGETERNTRMAAITVNSRLFSKWTHTLNTSYSRNWNDAIPYTEMPEGRVRVTSEWEDGTRDSRTLTFGGNRNMPTEARSRNFQLSNELSFIQPIRNQVHRLKFGASYEHSYSESRSTDNLFGSFSYASLQDFADNRPDRYERSLQERESETGRVNAGIFFGDTWRISQPLEVTLGLRWDYSALQQVPDYNPAVEQAFGLRTDVKPAAAGISPRIGFSYRMGQAQSRGMARSLTGGIGLFAGRAPTNVFNQAYRQTGLPNAEQRLVCIGGAVPVPDWDLYMLDPLGVPTTCADGGPGTQPSFSNRAPNVTVLNPSQSLPSSMRVDLGYRTMVMERLPVNFRYNYSYGLGLWGYRDINLDDSKVFTLSNEDRPFFGDPNAIVRRTGAVSLATSRLDSDFANVYEVTTDLKSTAHQLSTQVTGGLNEKTTLMMNYTLGFASDQGSAGGGIGRFGGGGGSLIPPTAANPNDREWAVSSTDRRHTLNLTLNRTITPEIEISFMGRLSSGTPFTPIVNRDINGDGMRNDRAFVFDPNSAPTPELAAGMETLLGVAPSSIRSCLESQLGSVADRNSCRNGWTQSLNMRANFRPNLPQLERRMTVSLDASNVLTGLDQIFNGRENMKGWGDGARADETLLYVRGFDVNTNNFIYEVNEGFGQARRGNNALRNPFAVRISGRVALGGNPARNNRPFGGGIGMAGGMGGRAGMMGGAMGGGRAGGGAMGGLVQAILRGGEINTDSILNVALTNPVRAALGMSEELALTEAQTGTLTTIAGELDEKLAERRAALEPVITELAGTAGTAMAAVRGGAAGGGAGPGAAAGGAGGAGGMQNFQRIQGELQPQFDGVREDTQEALARTRETLSEEQWEKLPPEVRNPPSAAQRAAGGGFNAVGTLDRMLANPLPVLLELKEDLDLTAEQTEAVQAISTDLNEKLNKRRQELGQRFDNVPAAQQARIFQEIQPEIEKGREEIRQALARVQQVLTPAQWDVVPAQVRNPFAAQGQGPGQGGQQQGGQQRGWGGGDAGGEL